MRGKRLGRTWGGGICSTDHPRACGANSDNSSTTTSRSGSSPRVRGKRVGFLGPAGRRRIIPARAGQTPVTHPSHHHHPDHPRACGANQTPSAGILPHGGSSPRVRGKLGACDIHVSRERIIPARAGQTSRRSHPARTCPDHPRACGANFLDDNNRKPIARLYGSSPRVRGKQSDFMRKLLSAGPSIIGFAQWLQSSCYCSCFQSSAKTPISRGTTPTSLFLGFQNSITLLLLT